MGVMKQCEYCPDYGVTCQSIKQVEGGILVKIDTNCPVMKVLEQINKRVGHFKDQLPKGGVRSDYKRFVL